MSIWLVRPATTGISYGRAFLYFSCIWFSSIHEIYACSERVAFIYLYIINILYMHNKYRAYACGGRVTRIYLYIINILCKNTYKYKYRVYACGGRVKCIYLYIINIIHINT
jgi:hypothetical protein